MASRWTYLLVAASLTAACTLLAPASLRAEEGGEAPPAADTPPATPPAAESAPAPAADTPPAAPVAGDGEAKAKELLEQQAAQEKTLNEELRAQSLQHMEAGKRLMADFDYKAAKQELERAWNTDRTNKEAYELLTRINDILGYRESRIKSAVENFYGFKKATIQEQLVQLDTRIDWGNRFARQAAEDPDMTLADRIRRYEQALQAFERARETIKYMPPEVDVDEQQHVVERRISEVRKAIKATEVDIEVENKKIAQQVNEERKERLRRAKQQQTDILVDQARALFEHGEYVQAEQLARKILEDDPSNPDAHAIEATARDRRHISTNKWIDDETREQSIRNRERADRMSIPHGDYLIYPKNWHEVARRTGDSYRKAAVEPWKDEIMKKLTRRVSFEFIDTPLEEALKFLDSLVSVNIILDPKIVADGSAKLPVELKVSEMEMSQAMNWMLKLTGLTYTLQDEAIFITKKENIVEDLTLEVYDVRDLTTTITDFPGPRIELGVQDAGGGGGGVGNPFAQQAATTQITPADLATLIQEKLLPADFAGGGNASITEQNGQLVVMQRPEVHEKIRKLLQSFRETQTIQVLTQVRFIDVQEGFLEQIGVHFTGLDSAPGDPGIPFARVDPLRQPSKWGLFPIGGGPGLTPPLPSDVQPSPAFQFQDSVDPATGIFRPPFHFDYGPPSSNPEPRTILLLRPRLDPNFPTRGNAVFGPANAPAGFRRQWYENWFGSPTLVQGLIQNLTSTLADAGPLGPALTGRPLGNQGALFQFRFFHSVQASAVVNALRKEQQADTLLAPKLMQFNNQQAHIMVAEQRSFIADYDVSGAVFDPVIRSFLTGVVLDVKPTVSHDRKYITLQMRPGTASELTPPRIIFITDGGDINNPLGLVNLPIELPNIELRSINTTVTVPDNGTLLFSGLINDQKLDAKSGVPFFSDLPIVGRLFSQNYKQRERRNLLVLVNSRVVLFDEEEANRGLK
ncbi:MAG: hypothetical protein L6R28_01220 [Planctomycetes bacterium]|nr:hypothetical protein [Planctomycetota bacterium]